MGKKAKTKATRIKSFQTIFRAIVNRLMDECVATDNWLSIGFRVYPKTGIYYVVLQVDLQHSPPSRVGYEIKGYRTGVGNLSPDMIPVGKLKSVPEGIIEVAFQVQRRPQR